jgi:hypothetical protein
MIDGGEIMEKSTITPTGPDEEIESAKLDLALLKENYAYQSFFKKLKHNPYQVCPGLIRPNEKALCHMT